VATEEMVLTFTTKLPTDEGAAAVAAQQVTDVRYTANQPFPQCAVYSAQGRPALPFAVRLDQEGETATVL